MPGLATEPDLAPAPADPPPAKFGVDERATWAAYLAALRGVDLGRKPEAAATERALPSAA